MPRIAPACGAGARCHPHLDASLAILKHIHFGPRVEQVENLRIKGEREERPSANDFCTFPGSFSPLPCSLANAHRSALLLSARGRTCPRYTSKKEAATVAPSAWAALTTSAAARA